MSSARVLLRRLGTSPYRPQAPRRPGRSTGAVIAGFLLTVLGGSVTARLAPHRPLKPQRVCAHFANR
jgi:hypothetical protein